jgi:hypothetical protein
MPQDEDRMAATVELLTLLGLLEPYKDYINEVTRLKSVWFKDGTCMRLFYDFLRNVDAGVATMKRLKAYRGLPGTAGTLGGAIDGTILNKVQEFNAMEKLTIYTLIVNRKTFRLVVGRLKWESIEKVDRFSLIKSGNFFLTHEEGEAARDRALGVM